MAHKTRWIVDKSQQRQALCAALDTPTPAARTSHAHDCNRADFMWLEFRDYLPRILLVCSRPAPAPLQPKPATFRIADTRAATAAGCAVHKRSLGLLVASSRGSVAASARGCACDVRTGSADVRQRRMRSSCAAMGHESGSYRATYKRGIAPVARRAAGSAARVCSPVPASQVRRT
jgi:hypothetical protein